jgi:hypothetical protein
LTAASLGDIQNKQQLYNVLMHLHSYFRALNLSINLSLSPELRDALKSFAQDAEEFHASDIQPAIINNYVKYKLQDGSYSEQDSLAGITYGIQNIKINDQEVKTPWQIFHQNFNGSLQNIFSDFFYGFKKLDHAFNKKLAINLSNNVIGYASANLGKFYETKNAQIASNYFFNFDNQKRPRSINQLADKFSDTLPKGIQVNTNLKATEVIIANAKSLEKKSSLSSEQCYEHEEKLTWNNIDLSIRRKPSPNNIGNLVIRNLGCYGHRKEGSKGKKDILDDFNEVIGYSSKENFINVLKDYGFQPYNITLELLMLPDNVKGKQLLEKIKKSCYLIYCAEIFRYLPVDIEGSSNKLKQLPFALALGISLELLEKEAIELKQVFEKDAPLGLPTGTLILHSKNYSGIKQKWENLLTKKQKHLISQDEPTKNFLNHYRQGWIVEKPEAHLELLKKNYGNTLRSSCQNPRF